MTIPSTEAPSGAAAAGPSNSQKADELREKLVYGLQIRQKVLESSLRITSYRFLTEEPP